MTTENNDSYLKLLSDKLSHRQPIVRDFRELKDFPLPKGKSMYILDYLVRKPTFQKGITEMLGYEPDEFTFEIATTYFHPEDHNLVSRLIRATLMFASENPVTHDVGFCLTYRLRHKNGNYLKVMRQSTVYEVDTHGKIISNLSMLTDISYMNTSNRVEWRFDAPGLNQEKFKKYVTKEHADFFSEREMEILRELKSGAQSKEIASRLHISRHTVDTHRRRMLEKSNCLSTIELLNFCLKNGIL